MDFICKRYGFPVFNRKLLPFIIWFYHILLNNDVSLHILVVLVVTIPTSPRLSKTEFGSGSYCGFSVGSILEQNIKGKKKKGVTGPACQPAQAGSLAGAVGWAAGRLAGPGRVTGRLGLAGPRLPGRPRTGSQAGAFGWAIGRLAGPGRVAGRLLSPVRCHLL